MNGLTLVSALALSLGFAFAFALLGVRKAEHVVDDITSEKTKAPHGGAFIF
ncbi:hypothetical protein [Roseateles amylovorans]|uniref:Uncharacterized protein n=1 Tax=Roseateles amylovorans TaxID=2978473 RepID=A0ABY6AZF0_9BURK|nr:hypothetical protein [Roseateles amylovorans]UXH77668.1 hypothetical protein N4261_22210 [Roseateles amylovorans]